MVVGSREWEYKQSTDEGIEYSVRHYEHNYAMHEGPCEGFMTLKVAGGGTDLILCSNRSRGGEHEDYYYYQRQQRDFITELRSHYPDISIASADKVSETFMEILLIANAGHKCIPGAPTTLHTLHFKIQPRSSTNCSPHHRGELIISEEEEEEDEDEEEEDVVWLRPSPATRASIAELLKAASRIEEEEDGHLGRCGICMEDMGTPRNTVRMRCSHLFHRVCLLEWLNNGHSCPICRYQMPVAQYRSDLSTTTH